MTTRVRTVQDPTGAIDGYEYAPAPLPASECVWCHTPLAEGAGIVDAEHRYCDSGCVRAHVEWSARALRQAGWVVAGQPRADESQPVVAMQRFEYEIKARDGSPIARGPISAFTYESALDQADVVAKRMNQLEYDREVYPSPDERLACAPEGWPDRRSPTQGDPVNAVAEKQQRMTALMIAGHALQKAVEAESRVTFHRPIAKTEAIKRIMAAGPNPLTEKPHSASSAETFVEQDTLYAAACAEVAKAVTWRMQMEHEYAIAKLEAEYAVRVAAQAQEPIGGRAAA